MPGLYGVVTGQFLESIFPNGDFPNDHFELTV